jgi:protein tyrosine/serine phosphatase
MKLIQSQSRGILIHCNLGKDRTGCIVALLQLLLGFSHQEIIGEYIYGGRNANPANIKTFLKVVEELGGVEKYLESSGLLMEDMAIIRKNLSGS